MKVKHLHIIGIIFSLIVGTLIHYTYEWSGNCTFVGLFSAVNESVWEHSKLIITPIVIFTIIEYFLYGKTTSGFILSKFVSIIIGIISMIIIHYTLLGIMGEHNITCGIITFIASIIIAYWFSYKYIQECKFCFKDSDFYGKMGFIILIGLVIIFTFNPPQISLFQDSITGQYGI